MTIKFKNYSVSFSIIILFSINFVIAQNRVDTNISNTNTMGIKIDTVIDTDYNYKYEGTKFVPPSGKTLLIMGQTEERINEYINKVSNQTMPAGWSAYWAITEFNGITSSHTNETGSTQNHQMLVDKFPHTVIQSALWMVGKWSITSHTCNGHYDKVLKQYAKWAKAINRPIYLRIGYEFDGPHNELTPHEYIEAYRYIVDYFRKLKVTNIAYVWHSYASKPFKDYDVSAWYPGDDYVHWVAISVFGHAYTHDFGPYCNNVLQFAKTHKKPVMIAESNPVNGIKKEDDSVWEDWFVHYFSFVYNKNIKAISFINEDWPSLNIPGIEQWKDARLYNNEYVINNWFKEVNKEKYLKQSDELFEILKYKK